MEVLTLLLALFLLKVQLLVLPMIAILGDKSLSGMQK
jgi:hypothetical protein